MLDVFGAGLNFVIQQPIKDQVFQPYVSIPFSATASAPANLELYLNSKKIVSITGTSITNNFNLAAGEYWIRASAITTTKTITDSVYVYVARSQVT